MYAKVVDNVVETFPYTINQMKAENPGVSFRKELTAAIMSQFNMVRVWVDDIPNVDPSKFDRVRSETPEYDGEKWVLRWTVTPKV